MGRGEGGPASPGVAGFAGSVLLRCPLASPKAQSSVPPNSTLSRFSGGGGGGGQSSFLREGLSRDREGMGREALGGVCPRPHWLRERRPPGAGQRDHTKAPTTACLPRITLLPITMQQGPQPAQRRIQLPHSTPSHRPDSTIGEMAFLARTGSPGRPAGGLNRLWSPRTLKPSAREKPPLGGSCPPKGSSWRQDGSFRCFQKAEAAQGAGWAPGKPAFCSLPVLTVVPGGEAVGQAAVHVARANSHSPGLCTRSAPEDIRMLWSRTWALLSCPSLHLEGTRPSGHRLPSAFSLSCPKWTPHGGGREQNRRHAPPLPSGQALPEVAMS